MLLGNIHKLTYSIGDMSYFGKHFGRAAGRGLHCNCWAEWGGEIDIIIFTCWGNKTDVGLY